ALRQITPDARKAEAFLYKPTSAVRSPSEPVHGRSGRRFVGDNPQPGTPIFYSLTKKADKVNLAIVDIDAKTVRDLTASTSPGLHVVNGNLTMLLRPQAGEQAPGANRPGGADRQPGAERQPGADRQPGGADRPQGFARGGGRGGNFGRPVPAGSYRIVLTV